MTAREARDLRRYCERAGIVPEHASWRSPIPRKRDLMPLLDPVQRPHCPLCALRMIVRDTKDGARFFWSCWGFPRCMGTRRINQQRFAAYRAKAVPA